MKLDYLEAPKYIPLAYIQGGSGGRTWETTEEISIVLSDGYNLVIPVGFKTDLRSVPKYLWSIIPPFNDTLLAYLIHDYLWTDKINQFIHFSRLHGGELSIHKARAFADKEMYEWSNALCPKKKVANKVSYWGVRLLGLKYYINKKDIPA